MNQKWCRIGYIVTAEQKALSTFQKHTI